jgi:hypothetical protein
MPSSGFKIMVGIYFSKSLGPVRLHALTVLKIYVKGTL